MNSKLNITNTLTGKKETFVPINKKKVGLNKRASLSKLKMYTELSKALEKTTFVQENAPEDEKIKKEILQKVDLLVNKNVIIASSSSGLLPSPLIILFRFLENSSYCSFKRLISERDSPKIELN